MCLKKENSINILNEFLVFSSTGFNVTYIGYVEVGKRGDAKQIDKAVDVLLSSNTFSLSTADGLSCERLKKDSIFQVEELGIKCVDEITNEVIINDDTNFD